MAGLAAPLRDKLDLQAQSERPRNADERAELGILGRALEDRNLRRTHSGARRQLGLAKPQLFPKSGNLDAYVETRQFLFHQLPHLLVLNLSRVVVAPTSSHATTI